MDKSEIPSGNDTKKDDEDLDTKPLASRALVNLLMLEFSLLLLEKWQTSKCQKCLFLN
jgi:hypothetical protein